MTNSLGLIAMALASESRAALLVVAAATLWGTNGTAQALGPAGASPIAVGATRTVVGTVVLVIIAASRGRLWAGARHLQRRPLVLAALAISSYQLCFFGGVRLAGVAIGTVVGVGSGPLWGGLVGWFGRGERPTPRWGIATVLALLGATLLATTTSNGGRVNPVGIALAVGAGASYALFTFWSKTLTDHHDPDLVMTWAFLLSAILMLPLGLAAGLGPMWSGVGVAMALWLGVMSLAVAYLLFGRGIAVVAVATATTLSLADPLTASVLGVVVLHEDLTRSHLAGMALVLAGMGALTLSVPPILRRS